MRPEQRLQALQIELPPAPKPIGAYVPVKQAGDTIFTSGILPIEHGEVPLPGRLGAELELADGQASARLAALNALAAIRAHLGNLDKVAEVLRLEGFVASTPQFREQPAVLNGASDLLLDIFGEAGKHTRFAVGVAVLPRNAPVELCLWVRVQA